MDNSPRTYFVHNDPREPYIRLRVAALCTCLDHGYHLDEPFTEEETVEFMNTSPTNVYDQDGREVSAFLAPHAFTYLPTKGNLQLAEKRILTGLIASIRNREIVPVQLRMDVEGEIDIHETWIKLQDLVDWCDIRSLEIGDLINAYKDGEDRILDAALNSGDDMRDRLETPHFDAHFNPRIAAEIKHNQITVDQYKELLAENVVLNQRLAMGIYPVEQQLEERPMQERERKTFLLIIAALCKEAGHDYGKHAKTAAIIKRTADTMGLAIGESTIEGKLKLIADAIESRLK